MSVLPIETLCLSLTIYFKIQVALDWTCIRINFILIVLFTFSYFIHSRRAAPEGGQHRPLLLFVITYQLQISICNNLYNIRYYNISLVTTLPQLYFMKKACSP